MGTSAISLSYCSLQETVLMEVPNSAIQPASCLPRRPTSEPQERNSYPPCLPAQQVSDFSRVSPILAHVPLGRNSSSELKFSPMEARVERRNMAALSPEFLQLPSCPGPFMANTQVSIKRVFC